MCGLASASYVIEARPFRIGEGAEPMCVHRGPRTGTRPGAIEAECHPTAHVSRRLGMAGAYRSSPYCAFSRYSSSFSACCTSAYAGSP